MPNGMGLEDRADFENARRDAPVRDPSVSPGPKRSIAMPLALG
jgi:hypothetical protein